MNSSVYHQRFSHSFILELLAKMLNLLIICCLLFQGSAGESRVSGGSNASPGDFPFVVEIQLNGNHWCSGFIYNNNWIVTTASCVGGYKFKPEVFRVIVGQVSLTDVDVDESSELVSAVFVHNDYNQLTLINDIAMLQLSRAITLGNNVNAIELGNINSNDEAIVLGWADGNTGIQENLKFTTVPIRSDDDCSTTYNIRWDPLTMICAGNATHDACDSGDGGGPMVQGTSSEDYRVVGLVSHSMDCANEAYPTVYTRISPFSTWMKSTSDQLLLPTSPTDATTEPSSTITTPTVNQCNKAVKDQFLYVVSISSSTTSEHLCSGFVYNEQFIVTAASCVIRKSGAMLNVTVSELRFDRPTGTKYPVTSIFLHPEYHESNHTNNIALVKITGTLNLDGIAADYIYYEEADRNNPATVIGWASILDNSCRQSLSLLWADSKTIQTNQECSQQSQNYDGNSMICTKSNTDPCEFEVGAPLIQPSGANDVVVGIKSFFDQCSGSTLTTIYTPISYYYIWLLNVADSQP